MTGVEIKKAAEAYIEDFIDDPDALYFLNRVLNMIGDMALIYETVEGTIEKAHEWYELPPTVTNVREVETAAGMPYFGFKVRDNLISFDRPGSYRIHYRRLPRPMSGLLEEPEIHPAFHHVMVTGLIALWKLKDDDENPDGLRHLQMFREDAARVAATLSRTRGPNRVKVIR